MRTGEKFERLVEIMAILRSENGCPWDKEQTHLSLRPYLIEETYEVLEMLDEENIQELPKELGDLLLQIIFHAQIAFENKNFTINTIIDNINEKLVSRHPHVFGHVKINSAQEQSIHWEKVKRKEGRNLFSMVYRKTCQPWVEHSDCNKKLLRLVLIGLQ